jgi:threonine dehydrogenase-like Zn-dependent dehydrogenase
MRQASIHGAGDLRVDEVERPTAGPRDVVLKVAACGVCGSDLTYIKLGGAGKPDQAMPMPLGHEMAGVVAEVGGEVAGVRPGMRMILNPMSVPAVVGCGGPEGAFSDYVLVRGAELNRGLYEVPAGMPMHVAALTEPMGVARHGVNRANPRPESKCVVFGVGPIGLGAVLWLKRRGVRSIVAVDTSRARLAAAKALGADEILVAGQRDMLEALVEIHGAGPPVMGPTADTDVYLDFAGAPQVVADVINVAKRGAVFSMVALHPQPETMNLHKLVVKEISLLGSCGYPNEYPEVIADLATLSEEQVAHLVSHRIPFDRFFEAIETARDRSSAKVVVEFA